MPLVCCPALAMEGSDLRRRFRGAGMGVGAGVVALGAGHLSLVETFELRAFYLRVRLFADPRRADPGIVAVVVDQKSLDKVAAPRTAGGLEQGWPWPRHFYAGLVRYLVASGARAVVFDFLFSERSIYTQLGVAEDDTAFAEASSGQRVVQAIMLTHESSENADSAWALGLREAALTRRLPSAPAEPFNKATPPIRSLLRAAAGVGWIGFEPDDDAIARTIRLAVAYAPVGASDAIELWSLPLAAASIAGARLGLTGEGATRQLRGNGPGIPLDDEGPRI